jgi:hypothetical protein
MTGITKDLPDNRGESRGSFTARMKQERGEKTG